MRKIRKPIISTSLSDTTENVMFKSREEYEYLLGNCTLTLADNDIIEHSTKNRKEFESIKEVLLEKE